MISKELFCTCLEEVMESYEADDLIYKASKVANVEFDLGLSYLASNVIKLLIYSIFGNTDDDNFLWWWIDELDFGRNELARSVDFELCGKKYVSVDLSSAENLYDFLKEEVVRS